MDAEVIDIVSKRMEELPPYVKEAIKNARPGEKIRTIAAHHKLHIDQQDVLESEVMLVMLALSEARDFAANFSREARIDISEAEKIAEEVSRNIFDSVRETMRKHAEQGGAGDVSTEQSSAPSARQTQSPEAPTQPNRPHPIEERPVQIVSQSPVEKPVVPVPPAQTAPAPAPAPAPTTSQPPAHSLIDEALSKPAASPEAKLDVGGIAPQKPAGYKTDPYRELPE
jgi:hypothetical protein